MSYLGRRLNDPNGNFIGMVLVSISAEVFSNIYSEGGDLGNGTSLFHAGFWAILVV